MRRPCFARDYCLDVLRCHPIFRDFVEVWCICNSPLIRFHGIPSMDTRMTVCGSFSAFEKCRKKNAKSEMTSGTTRSILFALLVVLPDMKCFDCLIDRCFYSFAWGHLLIVVVSRHHFCQIAWSIFFKTH